MLEWSVRRADRSPVRTVPTFFENQSWQHARLFQFSRCGERSSFPGLTAPIAAGRPGTLRAIESALKGERLVFAVAQRDNTDEPTPDILYSMGVIARIGQIQRGLGGVQLLLQGEQRATVAPVQHHRGLPQRRRHAGRGDEAGQRERSGLRRAPQGAPRARRRAGRAARPAGGGRAPGARRRHRPRSVRRPRRRLHRAAAAREAGPARDAERRGAPPPRARARPEADRHARGAGRDQVAGPGRARASASARCTCASR